MRSEDNETVRLDEIEPNPGGAAKGFVPYRPQARKQATVNHIKRVFYDMREADALPIGPRQVGYRLTQLYDDRYEKKDFDEINRVIKRLAQAQVIPFDWIADGSVVDRAVRGVASIDEFLTVAHDYFQRDLRGGQPLVVEVFTEAKETLPLIARLAQERGVRVYSGSGSSGPNLARDVALRALERAVRRNQSTLLLGIGDFDESGIKNIIRPHVEHIAAFLYGTSSNEHVVALRDDDNLVSMDDLPDCSVTFRHLALTPEMALDLVEDEDDLGRIVSYADSGDDVWSRDLDYLKGLPKIEVEALNPVALRNLVTEAIDDALDTEILESVRRDQEIERDSLRERFANANEEEK